MVKKLFFCSFLVISLNAQCEFVSITDIYKNDKLVYNKNYIIKNNQEHCKKINNYYSSYYIKKGHRIYLNQLSNLKNNVVIDFGNDIYVIFDKSEIVEQHRNDIKIKKNNKIKKINFQNNIRN